MIEIPRAGRSNEKKTRVGSRNRPGQVRDGTGEFSTKLAEAIEFQFSGTIDELLTDLAEQERRFMDQQTLYELSRYRAMVQKILKLVLEESFTGKSLKTRSRSKELTVCEIDDRLLAISEAITRHNRAFNLLKTIEEIRGLLLDLVY